MRPVYLVHNAGLVCDGLWVILDALVNEHLARRQVILLVLDSSLQHNHALCMVWGGFSQVSTLFGGLVVVVVVCFQLLLRGGTPRCPRACTPCSIQRTGLPCTGSGRDRSGTLSLMDINSPAGHTSVKRARTQGLAFSSRAQQQNAFTAAVFCYCCCRT